MKLFSGPLLFDSKNKDDGGTQIKVKPKRKICFWFILAFFCEILFGSFLIFTNRIPNGHDGFQYFSLQYYFLNHQVMYGDIPQWMPFMTQGTVASWWYFIQASFFQNVLGLFGGLLKAFNFISLFHLNIFFDRLLLLVGIWLLGGRFFSSRMTVFFVSVSVMFSSVWMLQPWFNFHFYYAIPLILYFGHCFFEKRQWRYFVLAGNLLFLQSLGSLPYQLSVVSLVIALYFFFYFICHRSQLMPMIKGMRYGGKAVVSLAITVFSFVGLFYLLKHNTQDIVTYNPGRNWDGSNSLAGFLSFANNFKIAPWLETVVGVSPAFDYTLFMGMLAVPLVVLGFFAPAFKKNRHIIFLMGTLFLIAIGSYVATLFYYIWPTMKYYRHLSLMLPLIKLFACFLAGFGFEYLFFDILAKDKSKSRENVFSGLIIYFGSVTFLLCFLLMNPVTLYEFVLGFGNTEGGLFFSIASQQSLKMHVINSAVFSITFALLSMLVLKQKEASSNYRQLFLKTFLCLHLFNMATYFLLEMNDRTLSVPQSYKEINTSFQKMPFAHRRQMDFSNERTAFIHFLSQKTMLYWSTQSFVFLDQIHSFMKTDHWLKPLDQYMRVYSGQSLDRNQEITKSLDEKRHLNFPLNHVAAGKIAGLTKDKIQFFRNPSFINSDEKLAEIMISPDYTGDSLLIAHSENKGNADGMNNNDRLNLPYKVLNFDANQLRVSVDVPDDINEPVWMLYSDVWHSDWKALVNDQLTPVSKANLAYKAVPLNAGKNTVRFYFTARRISLIQVVIQYVSLFWVVLIIIFVFKNIFISNKSLACERNSIL